MWYSILKGQYHIEFGSNLAKVVVYFLTTPSVCYRHSSATTNSTSYRFDAQHITLIGTIVVKFTEAKTIVLPLRAVL